MFCNYEPSLEAEGTTEYKNQEWKVITKNEYYLLFHTAPAYMKSAVDASFLIACPDFRVNDADAKKWNITVGYVWSAEIALAMEENPDIQVIYPTEGPYVFMDNWAIPTGSKHFDAAMDFINFMLDSETAEMVSEEFPYLCPNTVAVEAMGAEYSENLAKNPPADVIASGEYVSNLFSFMATLISFIIL